MWTGDEGVRRGEEMKEKEMTGDEGKGMRMEERRGKEGTTSEMKLF